MIGALAVAGGSLLAGKMQSDAASKAAKAAKNDRRTALRLSYDDYANNSAMRDADQAELSALRDRDQGVSDFLRDFDQTRSDLYREKDQAIADAYRDRDQIVSDQITMSDQARAIEYARSDEGRMAAAHREAVGYDFTKLVKDAQDAGFNPLTALAATGAANYARTAAPVVSTPFVSRSLVGSTAVGSSVIGSTMVGSQFQARERIDSAGVYGGSSVGVQNAQQSKVAASGYVGDVIAGMGDAYIGYTQEQARAAADRDLVEAIKQGGSRSAVAGGFAQARVVDARPVGNVPATGYVGQPLPSESVAGVTPVVAGGQDIARNPWFSDASIWGQRYGEPGEWVGGVVVGAADAYYNLPQPVREKAAGVVGVANQWDGALRAGAERGVSAVRDAWSNLSWGDVVAGWGNSLR